jgi:hypothetical protein
MNVTGDIARNCGSSKPRLSDWTWRRDVAEVACRFISSGEKTVGKRARRDKSTRTRDLTERSERPPRWRAWPLGTWQTFDGPLEFLTPVAER